MEKRCRKNIPFPRKQPLLPRRGRRNELRTCRDKRTGVPSPRGFRPSEKKFSLGPPAADHPAHPPYSLRYRRRLSTTFCTLRNGPCRQPGHDVEVTISPGTSFTALAEELERLGAASDADKFVLLARWKKVSGKLRSGRFRVNTGWIPEQVLDQLINGSPCLKE